MPVDHSIRRYIDHVFWATQHKWWTTWDPLTVAVGDYGTLNDNGELTVEGNIYDDTFRKFLKDSGLDLDLKSHPPEVLEPSRDHLAFFGTGKEHEFNPDQHVNDPEIVSSPVKGTWRWQDRAWKSSSNGRGALIILVAPRQQRISEDALTKILNGRILKEKCLVTSVFSCPGYLSYLANKPGDSISVALRTKFVEQGKLELAGWWTDKEADIPHSAFHPNAEYSFTPLFSLRGIFKQPKWKGPRLEYEWENIYPNWPPLDENGNEIEYV